MALNNDDPFLTTEAALYAAVLVGVGGEHGTVPDNEQCESVVRLARRSSEREWAPIPRDELLAELRTLRRQKQTLLDYCAFVDDQNAKDSRRTLHTRIIRRQLGEPDDSGARDEENTDG